MDAVKSAADSGRRLLRFLSSGPASIRPASIGAQLLLEADGRGTIAVPGSLVELLVSRGFLVRTSQTLALSQRGAVLARRLDDAGAGRRDVGLIILDRDSDTPIALANLSESPLAQLVRRRGKDGKPFLTTEEYQAGERLRADYTRGRIMPRLGANWIASVSSGKRSDAGGGVELTDAALAARKRVEDALAAVGPELSGVLIDICCFLKGLEQVESERGWPVRSAKIVLKTALSALARHYNPARKKRSQAILHWGAEDYRPSIS